MIRNPILPGFNPDPSICRVGKTFYIATSTFEWYPGVQIHASEDLANWRLVSRPLNRAAQLDMRGNPDSGGIWAPCLSHANDKFWLVYTDVKRLDGAFKDAHNYIVCSETIDGDWSDPWYVNSSGFDPSLFHDADGRMYFVNIRWNHRGPGTGGNPAHASFDGILCQEWSPEAGLIGAAKVIFDGSPLGLTEAPHLYRRGDWYYLTTAEGGTGYDHAVTMARSKDLWGPYQMHPDTHVLTSRLTPDAALKRVGHGQIVEADDGQTYHTFLCGRPLPGPYCPLGRETGIERCVWRDDWLYTETGHPSPRLDVPHVATTAPREAVHRRFDGTTLPPEFQWLRTPYPERIFTLEHGGLTLIGRESLGSWNEQSLVARRQEDHAYSAETELTDFTPSSYQQAAGLTTYYNRHKFHALTITHDSVHGRVAQVMSCNGDWPDGALTLQDAVPVPDGPLRLRVTVDRGAQHFFVNDLALGAVDARLISDEAGRGEHASFTGAFVGMMAFDVSGQATPARFSGFDYTPMAV